jgi:Fur family transcriptional regulator, ferric uptake regulator
MSAPHAHEHPAPLTPREVLRAAKLRITGMRLALLEQLAAARQPATAQQIFDDLCTGAKRDKATRPDRVTVYRTLNTLVEAGLAHKVDPGDRVFRFSLTDHARCEGEKHDHEHPHFVCDSCGTVECLEGAEVVVKSSPARAEAEHPARRKVKQDRVVLHGTCETCVEEPARRKARR